MQNNKSPFFTIVLPIYNVENYLDRCINSILSQDFDNYEIILVDDGSKDSCPALCDKWALQDGRIRVVHKKNGGLGYARNTGIDAAVGQYILFIDSDDYILPGLLDKLYQNICKYQSDVVFYGFSRVDADNNVFAELNPCPEKFFYDDHSEIKNVLLPEFIAKNPHTGRQSNIRVSVCTCCINVRMLKINNLRFVSERDYISEDLYFYIELFNNLCRVSFIEQSYYCYCQNLGSLTSTYREKRYERIKHCYEAVEQNADKYEYDGEVQLRLKASFIATVLGCLKMEAGNTKNAGRKETYRRIKRIAKDEYLLNALNTYPQTFFNRQWRIFKYCVLKKHIVLLYAFLSAQYRLKGV